MDMTSITSTAQWSTVLEYIAILSFSHIWLEMPIQAPKVGILGNFGPLNVIIHHRDPKKAHLCVNPRLLSLSTVKIRFEGSDL